jgi:sec-independent protein translocase protein TatB
MSLGFPEIVVIFVIALLVLGPEKLPDAARKVGQILHEVRNFEEMVRRQVDDALREAQVPRFGDTVHDDPAPPDPNAGSSSPPPPPPPPEAELDDHAAPPLEDTPTSPNGDEPGSGDEADPGAPA